MVKLEEENQLLLEKVHNWEKKEKQPNNKISEEQRCLIEKCNDMAQKIERFEYEISELTVLRKL